MSDLMRRLLAPVVTPEEREESEWAECLVMTATIERRVTETLKQPTLSGVKSERGDGQRERNGS